MKNKITNFMKGRYGVDNLYMFMFYIYFILLVVNIFFKSLIINYIELIILFIMFYRMLSKNIYKRKKEEQKYLEIKEHIFNFFKKSSVKKDKNHIYKRCKKCHTIIRLPLPEKRGIKYTTCPKCKTKNKIIALRKIKIELIRKKK